MAIGLAACASDAPRMSAPPTGRTITGIAVTGQPVKLFDHATDQQSPGNIPDAQATAWREADGTVNLLIPSAEAYRMRGPDFNNLTIDPTEIYSSSASAHQIPEALDNYAHWLMGPYSLDGTTFYSLTHSEWYACLLNNDCASDNYGAYGNSWVASANALMSTDGGASWHLNTSHGSHIAVNPGYDWTGTVALQDTVYVYADNHSGVFQPTRVIRESTYYYCLAFYLERDFTQINPGQGIDEAPVIAQGYVLLRSPDITDPTSWETWSGTGAYYLPVADGQYAPFWPQQNGATLSGAPPQIVYDTTAHSYILFFTVFGGSNPVYYMTTPTLANPSWSNAGIVAGTASLITDPAGNVVGFNDANYVSVVDPTSPGYNFEFTGGAPYLLYSTFPEQYGGNNIARDLYRLQLTISYH